MCFRPGEVSTPTKTCPECGCTENDYFAETCMECGHAFPKKPAAGAPPGAPGAPSAPAAPGAPTAPGAPPAPGAPK